MAYLLAKILLALCVVQLALTQSSPDSSWSDFQPKSCCPDGYNQAGNYCVKCSAPQFFDAISGKCNSCPQGHFYNIETGSCDCALPCPAPRIINPDTKQCECPIVQQNSRLVYQANTNECLCPHNLPLWNGKYCVKCPDGFHFDERQRSCYHCPEGFIRDQHQCVPGL